MRTANYINGWLQRPLIAVSALDPNTSETTPPHPLELLSSPICTQTGNTSGPQCPRRVLGPASAANSSGTGDAGPNAKALSLPHHDFRQGPDKIFEVIGLISLLAGFVMGIDALFTRRVIAADIHSSANTAPRNRFSRERKEPLLDPSVDTAAPAPLSARCQPAGIGPAGLCPVAREYLGSIRENNRKLREAFGLPGTGPGVSTVEEPA